MPEQTSRRSMLRGLGAGAIATPAVAGCLGQSGGSVESITVAYVPIYPNMQHFVMQQEGYYDELPVDVSIERFSNGPSVVKAFASGDVDVGVAGITPAMVLRDNGTNATVLTANGRNAFKAVATTEIADLYERAGSETFSQFEAEQGRKLRFGAPPDGSVPDIVLRYWIERDLGVGGFDSVVSKSKIEPAKSVQTIQSGDIDATMIMEPFATIINQDDEFAELEWSGDIFPGHPMTGLFVNDRVSAATGIAESLVDAHIRATELVNDSPGRAAEHAASIIGSGVTTELAVDAMESRAADFISDPRAIVDQTVTMSEYVADVGNIDEPINPDDLFDFDPYDASNS